MSNVESFTLVMLYSYGVCLQQHYYIIGRDKLKTFWKVLKIDRLETSELNIIEDSTTYGENECADLLKRLDEGNKKMGGLKLVTTCYGIVGTLYVQGFLTMQSHKHVYCFLILKALMVFYSEFRICQISGTLLHATYNKKKESW